MPLSKIQSDILKLLASHRNPESDVAGSTPLNVHAPRFSGDIDVFHDREERVVAAAERDAAFLQENGYALQWLRRDPLIYSVLAERAGEAFVTRMPTDQAGLLFLKDGQVVQPDPARLQAYQAHAGQRRGHWPSSLEICSAMLERYGKPPEI